jgi:hypothetical protein
MLLSATSEGPRQITSIGSHCGRTLWAIPLRAHGILQAGRSRPRYASGATGIGKLGNGSRPKAISEVARLRRSLPEPDPENRAAISIRSARPPVIAVIGGLTAPDRPLARQPEPVKNIRIIWDHPAGDLSRATSGPPRRNFAVRKIMETGAMAAPTASVRFTYSTDLGSADRGGHSARVR